MGKINAGRVILGGIVAGIVIDVYEGVMRGVVLKERAAAAMAAFGKPAPISVKQIVAFNLWGLVIGLLTVWLYAAIRPRMGAGPKTAAYTGLFVWALVFALGVMPLVFIHLLAVDFGATTVCAEAVMMLIAGLAGAAVYKEEAA